jgi:hypothetical protein
MIAVPLLLIAQVGSTSGAVDRPGAPSLSLSEPIACRKITGYEDYVVLEPAELTRDEKLLVYCRPRGHTYVLDKKKGRYQAHLVEDIAVRRKGKQKPIWTRKKAIDFLVDSESPPLNLYLGTTIGLKGLEPGDYEAELIVTDELTEDPPATQVLEFKVIARRPPRAPAERSP